jgi:hypothetical protein
MPLGPIIRRVYPLDTFTATWKDLPEEIREKAIGAVKAITAEPSKRPSWLDIRPLDGFKKQNIWSASLTEDGLYRCSFSIDGEMAVLRRVGPFDEIDAYPE